jgi:HflK protein
MDAFLLDVVRETWAILKDASVFLLFGFLLAGMLAVLVPASAMMRLFGTGRVKSVLWAATVGAPLPLCSCGVIPAALGLRREGATDGATVSFLIATPETGVDSIAVSYALTDPLMTVARPVAGVATAITAGIATNILGPPRSAPHSDAQPVPYAAHGEESIHHHHHAHDHHHHTHSAMPSRDRDATPRGWPRSREAAIDAARRINDYAFRELLDETGLWLALALVISGVFAAALPADLIERYLGGGIGTMLIMLLIGVPIYTCASASTPIAAALVMKGLSPGAALVFLLGGPATNIGSIVVLLRFLGPRIVSIYLASISVVAILAGLTLDWLYVTLVTDPRATFGAGAAWIPEWVKITGAVVLLALLARSFTRTRRAATQWLRPRVAELTGIDPTPRRLAIAATAVAALIYIGSGIVTVGPGEIGVRTRFGRIVDADLQPGLHWRLPWPFESDRLVDRDAVQRLELAAAAAPADPAPRAASLMFGTPPAARSASIVFRNDTPLPESFQLTGDGNLIDLRAVIQYRIRNVPDFVATVREPQPLLRALSQAALRDSVATEGIDDLYTSARDELEVRVARTVQDALDRCRSGIEIMSVRLRYVHPPDEVHDAFRDVASAQEDKLRTINRAAGFAIERVNEARAEAVTLIERALAFKDERTRRAEADASSLARRLDVYAAAPEPAMLRLRLEAAETALQGTPKIVTPGAGGLKEVDLWLFQPFAAGKR